MLEQSFCFGCYAYVFVFLPPQHHAHKVRDPIQQVAVDLIRLLSMAPQGQGFVFPSQEAVDIGLAAQWSHPAVGLPHGNLD